MSLFFYDGQIRRYLTQMIRMLSHFNYKTGDGSIIRVPAMYGDMTRQVANIIKENSENKLPSVPRIALYIKNIEIDRDRTSDSTYVSKLQIREREFNETTQQYTETQGKNYTVERLMPTPYKLTVNADIWSSNTEQKLQIFEQIAALFNPSIEIQTTDNFVDWTSLTVVNLDTINFSSRSIPVGAESEIDILTLTFTTPIWISPPAKVKKMGIITNIIMNIFDEATGAIDLGLSQPQLNLDDTSEAGRVDRPSGSVTETYNTSQTVAVNYRELGVSLKNNTAKLQTSNSTTKHNWWEVLTSHPGTYTPNVSKIFLKRLDTDVRLVGTFQFNAMYNNILNIVWDTDTFPSDTMISSRSSIDYVIDPTNYNPVAIKRAGTRILILENVGDPEAADGPRAWKQNNGDDFYASANDIIEWTGTEWIIVFAAADSESTKVYTTNLNTKIQYMWTGSDWIESINGYYPPGSWRIELNG